MLELLVDSDIELYDEKNNRFVKPKNGVYKFEHSLISLHKWEIKYKKPFLGKDEKTYEETKYYIRCMALQPIDDMTMDYICNTKKLLLRIKEYIDEEQTATFFREDKSKKKKNGRVITAELIYFWMIQFQIPVEFEKWHLSQLLTLINVCNEENKAINDASKNKKLNRNEAYNRHRAARAAYRSKHKKQ